MADETPQAPPSTPAPVASAAAPATEHTESAATPLDKVPLSEFIARRTKGESATTAPPSELPAEGDEPGEDTPTEEKPEDKGKPGKPKSRFEERLGTLTRQRHDAERRAQQLEAELNALRQSRVPEPERQPQQEVPVPDGQAPNLDQFLAAGKTYEDWMTALIDYRTTRHIETVQQRYAREAQQREFEAQLAGFKERTEAAKSRYADFDDVVVANDRVILSPVMQDIARRSPNGPDIMYWLGTHETEANQLGELTRSYPQAAYPLVEAHLLLLSGHSAANNGTSGAKKAVSISQAPAPISPVGGGTTTQPASLDQAPLGDFIRRRNAEMKKRQG